MPERSTEANGGLAGPGDDPVGREIRPHLGRDPLPDGPGHPVAPGLHDPPADVVYRRVVDRPCEVVGGPGGGKVESQLDVDLERLRLRAFFRMDPVTSLELHVLEDDAIGHRVLADVAGPDAQPAGRQPRTMASAALAARRFGRTSWTRTTSTPAATPRTVVAIVASTR